jgi:hypothetical protein
VIRIGQELTPRDSREQEARETLIDGRVETVRRWDWKARDHVVVTYPDLETLNVDYYVALPGTPLDQEQLDNLIDLLSHHSTTGEFGGPSAELDSQNEILALVEEIARRARLRGDA